MLAIDAALNAVWAIEPDYLARMLDIASRQNEVTPEALEAYRAETLKRAERARERDGVAIIEAHGPLFKRANMFAAMSGATSYEMMRRDLQTALDDPKVKAILFAIDSPGGEALGTGELAQAIFDARGKKPIAAYVSGMGASAAYWIASAVDPGKIVVDQSALLGSIGVQIGMREPAPKTGEKQYRFISSQSPMKNADPGTDDGAAAIQSTVDAMAQVFVETVARNRGVATETVLSDFGKGGIFVGQDAVNAGLADRIGSFEGVLAELSAPRRTTKKANGAKMSDEAQTYSKADVDAQISAAVTAALQASNARAAGIQQVAAGFGLDAAAVATAIAAGTSVEAFAIEHAAAAAKTRTAAAEAAAAEAAAAAGKKDAAISALKSDEAAAAAAAASTGDDVDEESAEAIAARIAAA